MNERELISQLKTLRHVRPDKEWVAFTRASLFGPHKNINIIERIFGFVVPNPLAISAMVAIVTVLGGANVYNAGLVDLEVGDSAALTARLKHVSDETAQEVAEVQQIVREEVIREEVKSIQQKEKSESSAHTVVFNRDAQERENFQALLRERIETKIAYVKDLFAQVEDGDSVREIMQNPRRYEENFKIFGEGLDGQVKDLLRDAEEALAEGDLIAALDLVNAIEKLIKN